MDGNNNMILTEDYCCECDKTVHQLFSEKDFFAHKVGRVRCPNCGHAILPCNECEDHDACGDCPWKKAAIRDAMTDEEYIRHLRTDAPKLYKMFRDGEMGDHYKKIIEKVESEMMTLKEVNARISSEQRRIRHLKEKIEEIKFDLKATRDALKSWQSFKKKNFPKGTTH